MKRTSLFARRALTGFAPAISILVLGLAVNGASAATIESFDPQGSVNTITTGIDLKGRVFGYWDDAQSVRHGFVWATNGKITTFDAPGAVSTSVSGVDAKGNATGDFSDGTHQRSYLRSAKGDITVFDAKGTYTHGQATDAHGGTVGYYGTDGETELHGFVRSRNGKIKTIDSPGAEEVVPAAVTPDGTVAGWIFNGGGAGPAFSAFIRHPDKNLTVFNVEQGQDTQITGMNASGTAAGYCDLSKDINRRGFVRSADGAVTVFTPKGSINTVVNAIDADGTIVGFYQKQDLTGHAFVRTPDGAITSFDVKDARDTRAQAINANGVITGYWLGVDGMNHGYVRTP